MLRRPFFIFILVFAVITASYAAKPGVKPVPKAILKADSTAVSIRPFDDQALKAYSRQKEFQYNEVEMTPSLWTRFWRWFWHLFDFLSPKKTSTLMALFLLGLKYLLMVLGLGAVVFLILKLAGIDMASIFRRKPAAANLPFTESLENIHEINFDAELERAISQANYRIAVRLLYLKSLKQLSDASLVKWEPSKTNSVYVDELNNPDHQQTFKLLTRQFEYIWYGGFTIDAPVFNEISSLFQQFKSTIT